MAQGVRHPPLLPLLLQHPATKPAFETVWSGLPVWLPE